MIEFSKEELANMISKVAFARGVLEAEDRCTDKSFQSEINALDDVSSKILTKVEEAEKDES